MRPEAVGACGKRLALRAYPLVLEHGDEQYERFPALDAAWPEIKAALPVLIGGKNHRLQRFCRALNTFLRFCGRWDEALALSLAAEQRAHETGDDLSAAWRANDAAWYLVLRGNPSEALIFADRIESYWQNDNVDAQRRAAIMHLRGEAHALLGNHQAAIDGLCEALQLHQSLSPTSKNVFKIRNSLAGSLRSAGELDKAAQQTMEALGIASRQEHSEGIAACTGNLAELALDRQAWPDAERLAREALALSEPLGHKQLVATDSQRLAKALARQGRGAEGRCHAERAVALFTELRSPDLPEARATLAECLREPPTEARS